MTFRQLFTRLVLSLPSTAKDYFQRQSAAQRQSSCAAVFFKKQGRQVVKAGLENDAKRAPCNLIATMKNSGKCGLALAALFGLFLLACEGEVSCTCVGEIPG